MQEEIIKFETAKLTKEKGFDEITDAVYTPSGKLSDGMSDNFWNSQRIYPDMQWAAAPKQSLLQRWLREKHNLHLAVEFFIGGGTGFSEVYSCEVYNLTKSFGLCDFVYDTYEEALEAGLLAALKLIK